MMRTLLLFLGAALLGALVALLVRSIRHHPYAPAASAPPVAAHADHQTVTP